MLEIKKTAIGSDEQELMWLEEIITDQDEPEATRFLKGAVYNEIARDQQDRLKSVRSLLLGGPSGRVQIRSQGDEGPRRAYHGPAKNGPGFARDWTSMPI